MCGVIGVVGAAPEAAADIHLGLSFLQHRGQDAAGIATMQDARVFIEKGYGIAEDVFAAEQLAFLRGNVGIGHVRYATSGSARARSEIQPFYVNQPYGMTLVHNGNLTNQNALRARLAGEARRHIGSRSDSEVLLNVLASSLAELARDERALPDLLFDAVREVHRLCVGSYAVVVLIAGVGLLAFRDPRGIRPLMLGRGGGDRWLVASESAALRPLGFRAEGDIAPGEAVFIDLRRQLHRRLCAADARRRPCIFEYIYLARPDSTLDGTSVYKARMNMGRRLAGRIAAHHADLKIDCVVPVPDSGRVAAMELAHTLNIPYREGLVKNRHVGRTFISAGQGKRRQSVRKKLNVIESEFAGKRVLLVDDSVVRGTTGRELVALARAAGAERVYFASASPPLRYPNVYGIDIPTRDELLAGHRDEAEIAAHLGVDRMIYQSLEDLIAAVRDAGPDLRAFETSCFDGDYPVGDIGDDYLNELKARRAADRDAALTQRDLPLV